MVPFKPYDIRGIYPNEIDEDFAYSLGRLLGEKYNTVVVGIDSRLGTGKIKDYLIQGLLSQGVEVSYLGLVSTPLLYFATKNRFSLGVMITASHNPKEYTGFKICDKQAIPLLPKEELENRFQKFSYFNQLRKITEKKNNIKEEYSDIFVKLLSKFSGYTLSADFSNGSAIIEKNILMKAFPKINIINEIPNGNFPNHPPNAIGYESTQSLIGLIKKTKSDIGIIFDGDGDRIGIIDEKGKEVRGDILTAIIAKEILKHEKGNILYDLRSSRIVPETISKYGGTPIKTRVGHPFIKQAMIKEDAIFAGEFSNHFYFKEIGGFEAPLFALYYILSALNGNKLSQEVEALTKYFHSGEINIKVKNVNISISRLIEIFDDKKIERIDGVTIYDKNSWINVRPSNTEPLIRITAESDDYDTLNKIIDKIKEVLMS